MMSGAPRFLGLSPLGCEIQRCAGCGYCSWDLSDPLDLSPHILETDGYRTALRRDGEHGALAFLLSQRGDHRGAAMMYLHGAWIEDEMWLNEEYEILPWRDEIETPLSYEERKKRRDFNLIHRLAARRLRTLAIAEFLKTVPQRPEDRWLMADMLRCTGRMEEAKIQIERLLDDPRCHKIWPTGELERILINDRIETPRVINSSASRSSRNVFRVQTDYDNSAIFFSTMGVHAYLSKGFRTSGIGVDDFVLFEDPELLSRHHFRIIGIEIVGESDLSDAIPIHFVDDCSMPHPEKLTEDCPVVLDLSSVIISDVW